jgi:hypothetical protein
MHIEKHSMLDACSQLHTINRREPRHKQQERQIGGGLGVGGC